MIEGLLTAVAGVAATGFAADLWVDYRRRPRPHIAGYGTGITMFAVATWALFVGLVFGWTEPVYRIFFLLGAVLNIPFLALGSMFLVVGRRSGHVMTIALGALTAISTTLVATVPLERALPEGGIPTDMFATGFGPRLFAIIGGATGTLILVSLALVSAARFWRRDRKIVWGNLLIVAGVGAAAWRGTGLALGDASGFALSLLLAVVLIWAGYRVASGRRPPTPQRGPNPALTSADMSLPAYDVECWSPFKVWLFSLFHRTPKSNLAVVEMASPGPGDRFLDLGCGLGAALEQAAAKGAAVAGVDPSPTMVEKASGRIAQAEVKVGSAEAIPFPDGHFTVVITVSAYHHWADPDVGLREVLRVLAPGGRLLIAEQQLRRRKGHGLTRDHAEELADRLSGLGYATTSVDTLEVGRQKYLVVTGTAPS